MRTKAVALGEAAAKALRTTYPVLAVVAIFYALLLGALNILNAFGNRLGTVAMGVEHYTRVAVWNGPAVIPTLLGLFMFFLAYELWLRKKAALVVLCGFIVAQAAVEAVRGMSRSALAMTVLIAMVLALAIKQFPGRPDPASVRRLKVIAPVATLLFFASGVAGLSVMRNSLGVQSLNVYGLAYKSVIVAVGDSGLHFSGWGVFLRGSLTTIAMAGLLTLLFLVFRPYRERGGPSEEDRVRARSLVRAYGSDSLAYFNTRKDKNLFFLGDDCFLAYKTVGDVAVVSGDPVGPAERVPEIMTAFEEYCLARGWRVAVLGASGPLMPYYEEAGLKGFSLGEESIVDVGSFTLEGRNVRKLRQSVHKLDKQGYTVEFMYNSSIPAHMKHDLARISADWRGGKAETGFAMGLGRLLSAEDPDCLLCIAFDGEMKPAGFLYMVPMYPHVGYSLDVHRSRLDSPGALSEYMIARTAEFLQREGFTKMSLHFLAFSEHYREDREQEGSPFWRGMANVMDRILPVVSVYKFDRKFCCGWKKRYLLHYGLVDLFFVGLAAISAESALKITRPSDRRKAMRHS